MNFLTKKKGGRGHASLTRPLLGPRDIAAANYLLYQGAIKQVIFLRGTACRAQAQAKACDYNKLPL
jgi:hypothetical protein